MYCEMWWVYLVFGVGLVVFVVVWCVEEDLVGCFELMVDFSCGGRGDFELLVGIGD